MVAKSPSDEKEQEPNTNLININQTNIYDKEDSRYCYKHQKFVQGFHFDTCEDKEDKAALKNKEEKAEPICGVNIEVKVDLEEDR